MMHVKLQTDIENPVRKSCEFNDRAREYAEKNAKCDSTM